MSIRRYKCRLCEQTFEVLERHNGVVRLSDDAETDACVCGAPGPHVSLVDCPQGIELGDVSSVGKFYPRFDRGLNCEVRSAAHRKQIMAERGLVALEGDWGDIDRSLKESWRKDDESAAAYREQRDRFNRDPDTAEARRYFDRRGIRWTE